MTQSTLKSPRRPTPSAAPAPSMARSAQQPSHEEITGRARELWEAKGRPSGQDETIWLEAEAQLKKR